MTREAVLQQKREVTALNRKRKQALRDGVLAPCSVCGGEAPFVDGEVTKCFACTRRRDRPGAEIDWRVPWEMDSRAQELVSQHPDGLSREELSQLLGVTRESIRLVEVSAAKKLRAELEAIGLSEQDILAWLMRRAPETLIDLGGSAR